MTCSEELFSDENQDVLLNPTVVIEVLSESTEAYDRGRKFEHYQQVESVAEYLLVAQDQRRVERFLRQEGNLWLYSEAHDLEDIVRLESVDCGLMLRDVYAKVDESSEGGSLTTS